jgi:uncharacterized protein
VVMEVLHKMAKQRKESLAEFQRGGREDLAANESFELTIIESYLPKKMSADALQAVVVATLTELGITQAKDAGKAMKPVLDKVKGLADGKDVQAAVKAALGG